MIIGLSGKIGVGKNYLGEKIIGKQLYDNYDKLKINFISFGDLVKYEVGIRYDERLHDDNIDISIFNNIYKDLFIDKTKKSRKMLQLYATEHGRNGGDITIDDMTLYNNKNMWVNGVYMQIKNILEKSYDKKMEVFIICDIRFINEIEFIKKIGGNVIRINAPIRNREKIIEELVKKSSNKTYLDDDVIAIQNHISETILDNYDNYDYTIDNEIGNENNVNLKIKKIINEILEKSKNNQIK